MLTKVPKLSTVFIIVGHQKAFYHLGNVELFRCSSNKFLVDNLRKMYETHKRAEIPEPPGVRITCTGTYYSTKLMLSGCKYLFKPSTCLNPVPGRTYQRGIPGLIEKQVISIYPYTKIPNGTHLRVVLTPNDRGIP